MKIKRVLVMLFTGLALAVSFLASTSSPNLGGLDGGSFRVRVEDASPDTVIQQELLTQGGFNFSQMTTNATIRAWFDSTTNASYVAPTDTVRLHITGIGADSAYVDTVLVIGAGDTLTTARTFHMWEGAYTDTAVGGVIRIWPTGGVATTPLDTIPTFQVHWPMAHRLFGKRDAPLLQQSIFQWLGHADTSSFQLRYYPNLDNYRPLARRDSTSGQRGKHEVITSAWLYKGESTVAWPESKLMGPYSAIAVFSRNEDVPEGATNAATFWGRRTR